MSMGRMLGSLLGAFGGRALGGMVGGNTGRMIGSLAGSMLGGRGMRSMGGGAMGGGGLGSMLGGLLGGNQDDADQAAAQIADSDAEILIRAMCMAAKADGTVDQDEVDAITSRMGDLSSDEEQFLRTELSSPLDLEGFLRTVPQGMENEVYTMSLLAIDVDTGAEADYLSKLAAGLGLSNDTRNEIHEALQLS